MVDTYRTLTTLHPTQRQYTWHNYDHLSQTRINFIWCSLNLKKYLVNAHILKSGLLTDSDHQIVSRLFNTSTLIRNHNITKSTKKCRFKRTIYLYDEMTKELPWFMPSFFLYFLYKLNWILSVKTLGNPVNLACQSRYLGVNILLDLLMFPFFYDHRSI